ncbi:hypothetical protein BGW38_007069 [Lunasporangiospora selenospora]|uniref:Uncharacterized protein n=1 Tax=Lunasporangiospora selenospora TaxID=979761 RepID=A0A9P6FLV0_9FUNG|nr:hypothetical protein BGW38_007069 [Lunasporangiospora selenospora]
MHCPSFKLVLSTVLAAMVVSTAVAAPASKYAAAPETAPARYVAHSADVSPKTVSGGKNNQMTPASPAAKSSHGSAPLHGNPGQTGVIINKDEFCLFLPRVAGGNIAKSEDSALAFCTKPFLPGAEDARPMPLGFIRTSHYLRNTEEDWVQVTGTFDRSQYLLAESDGGGQYDMQAPVGAVCSGWGAFVQLTEPDNEIFCIRCCKEKDHCPKNKSTHGCRGVLAGDFEY